MLASVTALGGGGGDKLRWEIKEQLLEGKEEHKSYLDFLIYIF